VKSWSQYEEEVLRFWSEQHIFKKSLERRREAPLYRFLDGPPFATGLPHYGHLLASIIKDTVLRHWTMRGYYAPRRFGWDCHGLPVEHEVEKERSTGNSPEQDSTWDISTFNERCRSIVMRHAGEWETMIARIGRWVDTQNTWRTMDRSFMESTWWTFARLYEKGLIYKSYKVMPISTELGTPLSNFEASSNYKEVEDPAITVRARLDDGRALLVWTTTPWTLPTNAAIAVGPGIQYVEVSLDDGERVVLAESSLSLLSTRPYTIERSFQGSTLEGIAYTPFFPFFPEHQPRVVTASFVSTEEGTGAVHIAPAHGEDDFQLAQDRDIPCLHAVDLHGLFTEVASPYQGQYIKDVNEKIIHDLGDLLFDRSTIMHRYPFCWRSDTPLVYNAMSAWFVNVQAVKEKMLQRNGDIHWMPPHVGEHRFKQWLEGARDWSISRNRYWGTPIPIWESEDGERRVISSVQQLSESTGVQIDDLHRHHVDSLTWTENGKTFRRISEVFDCWFESGSMPWAQNGYPSQDSSPIETAHFIAEGLDQTRGWFYTLMVLSNALFDQAPFRNVIVNGIVLAEDGNKMSKRLKNYPDPKEVLNQYGADALRLYLLSSPAAKADDLRFSSQGVEQALKQGLIPLWNAVYFYATYASIHRSVLRTTLGALPEELNESSIKGSTLLDRWILSKTSSLCSALTSSFNSYDLGQGVQDLLAFVHDLTNRYIRYSRERFSTQPDPTAFCVLYLVLRHACVQAAPFVPFLAERIHQGIHAPEESVHLCDLKNLPFYQNESLEQDMEVLWTFMRLGHRVRKEHRLKVRQPLSDFYVKLQHRNDIDLSVYKEILCKELNVHTVHEVEDEASLAHLSLHPQFSVLGPRFKQNIGEVQRQIQEAPAERVLQSIETGVFTVEIDNTSHPLQMGTEVVVRHTVKEGIASCSDLGYVVAFKTQLTPQLIEEGWVRDCVHEVNQLRKAQQCDMGDLIALKVHCTPHDWERLKRYQAHIWQETGIVKWVWEGALEDLQLHYSLQVEGSKRV